MNTDQGTNWAIDSLFNHNPHTCFCTLFNVWYQYTQVSVFSIVVNSRTRINFETYSLVQRKISKIPIGLRRES